METSKICTSCEKITPITFFYKESARKDGYKSQCKSCTNDSSKKYQASYYLENKKSIALKAKLYRENIKHEKYGTWGAMKTRCNNPNHKSYHRYGGRGIKVSEDFNDFTPWLKYVSGLENYKKEGYTLDRINNDLNYEKGNLRWVNKEVQSANRVVLSKTNTSGFKGVFKDRETYRARIMHSGKSVTIVCGKTATECAKAYDKYIDDNNLPHTKNFS